MKKLLKLLAVSFILFISCFSFNNHIVQADDVPDVPKPDNPIYVTQNENIMIGYVTIYTGSSTYEHLIGVSYTIDFLFTENDDNQFIISQIQVPTALKIGNFGTLAPVGYIYDNRQEYIKSVNNDNIRADTINRLYIGVSLTQLNVTNFYNNLQINFDIDIVYNINDSYHFSFSRRYNYDFTTLYPSMSTWALSTSKHQYNTTLKGFNDFFLSGQYNGYNLGYDAGRIKGRQEGFEAGKDQNIYTWIEVLERIFIAISKPLMVDVLPNITLLGIILVPVILGVVFWLIQRFR